MILWLKEHTILALSTGRRSVVMRAMARAASAFTKGYENYSFNMRLNGELRVLQKLGEVDPSGTIFDVGANVGDWTALALQATAAEVHCFEIAQPTYEALARQHAGDKRVVLNAVGLLDRAGQIQISYAAGHDGHSTAVRPTSDGDYVPMQAQVTTGDDYIAARGLSNIALLKMDVEGAEHLVLQGFAGAFRRSMVGAVQFEYGRANIHTRFFLEDFYKFFAQYGFIIGKIYPGYVDFRPFQPKDEDFIGPNYLAVQRQRVDLIQALAGAPVDLSSL